MSDNKWLGWLGLGLLAFAIFGKPTDNMAAFNFGGWFSALPFNLQSTLIIVGTGLLVLFIFTTKK